jgi:hypothetical protein
MCMYVWGDRKMVSVMHAKCGWAKRNRVGTCDGVDEINESQEQRNRGVN